MSNPKHRYSYDAATKLKIIEFAEEHNNCAASKKFGVSESNVRLWRRNKTKLLKMPTIKHARRGKKPLYPVLERDLVSWVESQRNAGCTLTGWQIQVQAKKMIQDVKYGKVEAFKVSKGWFQGFMKRHSLHLRPKPSVSQELPVDLEDKIKDFHKFVTDLRMTNDFPLSQIGSVDKIPVSFDLPDRKTMEKHEILHFTVILCCLADGTKLAPMVIFKRQTIPLNENVPPGVLVYCQIEGCIDEAGILLWLQIIWANRPGGPFQKQAMLVWDQFRHHWTESVKKKLEQFRTHQAVIPGDMTNVLQPINVLNKPFKDHVNQSWILWMASNQVENASSGNLKTPDLVTVVGWVKQAWQSLPDGMIRRSFLRIGIDNSLDGTQDEQLCEEELKEELEDDDDDDEATYLSDTEDVIAGSVDGEEVGMEKSDLVHSAHRTLEVYDDPRVTQTEIIEFENGIKLKVEDISVPTRAKTKPQKPQPVSSRRDSSLVFLTQKFAEKLSRSVDGVLDINQISQELSVRKRRVYDITNVLEGIKLIKKKSKSHIQWLGRNVNDGKISQQLKSLIEEEKHLDELIQSCAQQIRRLCEDRHTHRYAYLTHADIQRIQSFKEQTVIVIKAPAETNIQVPHPEESLQIYIKSVTGPIEVFLCPNTVESSDHTAADRADGSQFNSTTSGNDSLPSPSLPCPQESTTKDANSSCEINGFSHHSPS